MAELEHGIYNELKGAAGVLALVGTRIYPDVLPQDVTYPAIVYSRIGAGKEHTQGKDSGLSETSMQVSGWTDTVLERVALRKQVRLALQDFSGDLGSQGVTVRAVLMDDETDFYDDSVKKYQFADDYTFWHLEDRTS